MGQVGPVIIGAPSQPSGPSREFSSPADSGHGGGTDPGTIAGIVIVLFLGALIIGIMVYYKFYLRFKRLKTELAHVHYIADPGTHPGMSFVLISQSCKGTTWLCRATSCWARQCLYRSIRLLKSLGDVWQT